MNGLKIFVRKLRRIKYLSDLLKRASTIAKLDKFWGFSRKDRIKRRSKVINKAVKVDLNKNSLDFLDKPPLEPEQVDKEPESSVVVLKNSETDRNYEYKTEKEYFKESVRDLRKLVYPYLDPITKRHFDEVKLIALGGKVAHNRKMPYKEFLQRQNALKRHLEKNKKLEKELGVNLTLDKKGGYRFAEIDKRKQRRKRIKSKPLFDDNDKDGIYRIKL